MGIRIGIGELKIGQHIFSWTPQRLGAKVLFWGKVSEISGGQMPNKVTGATDYLTVAGSAGSYTFQCPNTAPYIVADTDYIWFKTDASQRTTTEAELIGYDLPRTPVKYDNTTPYALREIIILSQALTTAEMNHLRDYADLSIWWDNILSAYGNLKQNRGIGQSIWTPESVYDADATIYFAKMNVQPNGTTKTLLDNFFIGTKADGVYTELDSFVLYFLHTEQASLLNIKGNDALNHTAVNAPTWAAKTGYTIVATSYIKSGFIPSSGVKYTLNDAGIFWNVNPLTLLDSIDGVTSSPNPASAYIKCNYGPVFYAYNTINSNTNIPRYWINGFCANVRISATQSIHRTNGSENTNAEASTALPAMEYYIGAFNNSGTAAYHSVGNKYKCYGFGSSMTLTKRAALEARLLTLYTGIQTAF